MVTCKKKPCFQQTKFCSPWLSWPKELQLRFVVLENNHKQRRLETRDFT